MKNIFKLETEEDIRMLRDYTILAPICLIALLLLIILCFTAKAQDYETQVVAEVIAAEAGGEGYQGMYAVANTIANRAKVYHKTPYQIVTQKNQYYGYTAKNRHILYLRVCRTAKQLATNILLLSDVTNGALYFRRPDEKMFKWCKVETYRWKNHIFYK